MFFQNGSHALLLAEGTGLTVSALVAPPPLVSREADESIEPGFTALFNGQDLTGWEGNVDVPDGNGGTKPLWKVEDGAIVGDSPGIKHNQFLGTTKSYGDFELRLQFRLKDGKGNTGVQFRSRRVPQSTEVSGYQADIGEKYWGCLYDESRRNKILVQAPPELENKLDKEGWNDYLIRAEGDRVTLTLNGVTTVDYREPDASIAREGIIALQVHSGPPLRVEFRKIRIQELRR